MGWEYVDNVTINISFWRRPVQNATICRLFIILLCWIQKFWRSNFCLNVLNLYFFRPRQCRAWLWSIFSKFSKKYIILRNGVLSKTAENNDMMSTTVLVYNIYILNYIYHDTFKFNFLTEKKVRPARYAKFQNSKFRFKKF